MTCNGGTGTAVKDSLNTLQYTHNHERLSRDVEETVSVNSSANKIKFKFFFFFFGVPQLYLWGSPLLGEIFAYVTVF